MRNATWLALLVLLVPAAGAYAGISVDHDKTTDFSKYQTYSLEEATPALNPLMRSRLVTAIEQALAAKGLRKAEGERA